MQSSHITPPIDDRLTKLLKAKKDKIERAALIISLFQHINQNEQAQAIELMNQDNSLIEEVFQDVSATNYIERSYTPLTLAIKQGCLEVVTYLITQQLDTTMKPLINILKYEFEKERHLLPSTDLSRMPPWLRSLTMILEYATRIEASHSIIQCLLNAIPEQAPDLVKAPAFLRAAETANTVTVEQIGLHHTAKQELLETILERVAQDYGYPESNQYITAIHTLINQGANPNKQIKTPIWTPWGEQLKYPIEILFNSRTTTYNDEQAHSNYQRREEAAQALIDGGVKLKNLEGNIFLVLANNNFPIKATLEGINFLLRNNARVTDFTSIQQALVAKVKGKQSLIPTELINALALKECTDTCRSHDFNDILISLHHTDEGLGRYSKYKTLRALSGHELFKIRGSFADEEDAAKMDAYLSNIKSWLIRSCREIHA